MLAVYAANTCFSIEYEKNFDFWAFIRDVTSLCYYSYTWF